MWIVLVLIFLTSGDSSATSDGIEKISHNIIRNISTYHSFYPTLNDDTVATYVSDNLIDWKFEAGILKGATVWSTGAPIRDVDINVIGPNKVRLYYTAQFARTKFYAIGVASALSVSGNFTTQVQPLIYDGTDLKAPSLVTLNNGSLVVIFGYPWDYIRLSAMVLNEDGTEVVSDVFEIITADQDWETGKVKNHWGIQRGTFLYIFYETDAGVGVARSVQMQGPYEKKLLSTEKKPSRAYFQNELKWGEDGWPVYQEKKLMYFMHNGKFEAMLCNSPSCGPCPHMSLILSTLASPTCEQLFAITQPGNWIIYL